MITRKTLLIQLLIQRNTFFTHPENVLHSMLTDEDSVINEFAVENISKARKNKFNNFRVFTVPTFNFKAKKYAEIIFWNLLEAPMNQLY